eukprot:5876915-Amphidinium_carterae.3
MAVPVVPNGRFQLLQHMGLHRICKLSIMHNNAPIERLYRISSNSAAVAEEESVAVNSCYGPMGM